jgi:predicted negative regulator of RcsB-dependent stress response
MTKETLAAHQAKLEREHAALYAVRTHRNTAFVPWWKELNGELKKRRLPEALYGDARDAYEMGQSPESEARERAGR